MLGECEIGVGRGSGDVKTVDVDVRNKNGSERVKASRWCL